METGPIDWPLVGKQVGLGAVLGFAVGFAAKKALKIALVVTAILFLALVGLQHLDFIAINWSQIEAASPKLSILPGALTPFCRGGSTRWPPLSQGSAGLLSGFSRGMRKG